MSAATLVSIPTPDGGHLAAEHHTAPADRGDDPAGRPCVVMAHGVGSTRDCGLSQFAETLCRSTGVDVIAFDYRHFGESSGAPRQLVSLPAQRDDYQSAITYARSVPGVNPKHIVLWGVSLSGGHVLAVAVRDPQIAGVIRLTPAVDGRAAVLQMVRANGVRHIARLLGRGIADTAAAARGHDPVLAPVVGPPGTTAALCAPSAVEGMQAIAGPTWSNTIAARVFLRIGTYRPGLIARDLKCPVLIQIADADQFAPPGAGTRTAIRARATVHHYPCDHFDIYPGAPLFERVVRDQVSFLRRILAHPPRGSSGGQPAPNFVTPDASGPVTVPS